MADIEVEIEEEKENKLLKRRDMTVRVYHEADPTPTRATIKDRIADLVGTSKDNVIIENIKSEFGKEETKVNIRVYDNKEDAQKYERDYVLERNKISGEQDG